MALLIILGVRTWQGEDVFAAWGWRIPFLLSAVLLVVSIWIRMQLSESPIFAKMKADGKTSKAPLTEAFGNWANAKVALLALFGATAGEAVIWYGGQFYALFFLTQTLKVNGATANILIAVSLAIGTPGFILFGWLSDKIGRKPIMLTGFALGAVTYFMIFQGLTHYANPKLEKALANAPVSVIADPAECSFQFNPVGISQFRTSCDIVKSSLVTRSVNYENQAAPAGTVATVKVGDQSIASFDGVGLAAADFAAKSAAFNKALGDAISQHGYPTTADPADINYPMTILLLTILVIYVTLVYGPIAAWLVEMFPTRIRYTGLSLPYHIGNGWFGGFLPATAFAIVAATGNIYSGLWYPIVIAAMSFVVAVIFLPETKDVDITKS
jgi:Major Facilitator Superfamily/Sugar (and other) transporter